MTGDPFRPQASRSWKTLRALLFLLAVLGVGFAVMRWRGRPAPSGSGGHDMAAMAGAADTARPVALTPTARQRIGVTFAPVDSGAIAQTVRVVGLVKEDETRVRAITTRVDGFVERLVADFTGREVRAGEVLLGLYAPDIVAAQSELLLALDLSTSVNPADAEALASARRAVDAARERLRLWSVPPDVVARLEQTRTVERISPVRSPWNGFVITKNVIEGQRVMAGDALYRLADLSVVWVEGEVFEQDLPLVRIGARVMVTFQALPGVEREGRVTYLYPTVDPATRTARIRVELGNADLRLKPGMYGLLQFDGVVSQGLTVPRSALIATGTRNLVFLKRADGRFEPREIVLGAATPDRIQVLRGLALGDTVVASGTFLLDAESNLGSLLGGMGDMPGMDISPPADHSRHEGK